MGLRSIPKLVCRAIAQQADLGLATTGRFIGRLGNGKSQLRVACEGAILAGAWLYEALQGEQMVEEWVAGFCGTEAFVRSLHLGIGQITF